MITNHLKRVMILTVISITLWMIPQPTYADSLSIMLNQPVKPETGPDSDGDWVSDNDEKRYGSNSATVDSDQDGLTDFEEIFIFATNRSGARWRSGWVCRRD